MKILNKIYSDTLKLAAHAKASYYLFALSFAESSFFPVPPDVMLAPMCLAKPSRVWFHYNNWIRIRWFIGVFDW